MVTGKDVLQSGILDYKVFPGGEDIKSSGKGRNKKGLLIALNEEETPELTAFLEKILKTVGFEMEDDTFRFWLTSPAPFWLKGLDLQTPFSHAIFFGVKPVQAGLNLEAELYSPLSISDKTYLFAHNLSRIQQEPALKRPLWEALKVLFK